MKTINGQLATVTAEELGLGLRVEEHRLGRGNEVAQLLLLRLVGEHGLVRVEHVEERLRRHQVEVVQQP